MPFWARMPRRVAWGLATSFLGTGFGTGCAGLQTPLPSDTFIREPILVPPSPAAAPITPPPAAPDDAKPKVTPVPGVGPLSLGDVMTSVAANFPLLLAVEQERQIALGRRISAEGAFDLVARVGGTNSEGSFGNSRLDVSLEQPTPYNGLSTFAGYRMGLGDYPIYNNTLKTADGGEFRAGFQLPLLRDGTIDRRRATIRQAQIAERLADPVIQRNRLDFLRSAARAYWAWVAAGERTRIQAELLKLAVDRQKFLEARVNVAKQQSQLDATDNERTVVDRRELLRAAELSFQQAAIELSVFICDADGNPVVPTADRLPAEFLDLEPPVVASGNLANDFARALELRPEIARLRLLRERAAVEVALARNQILPALNFGGSATQDVGTSKKTFIGTGPFASDLTSVNMFLNMELPVQRRDARGRLREAEATLAQLLYQERNQQNVIRAEVQEALARLEQLRERIQLSRQEITLARKVVSEEMALVQIALNRDVISLNIREFNAANAQTKLAVLLAEFYRAYADYLVAIGQDAAAPPLTRRPTEVAPTPKAMDEKK